MDQLIELLKQIQDLAGVAIDALDGAKKDADHDPAKDAGGAPGGGQDGGAAPTAPSGPPPA